MLVLLTGHNSTIKVTLNAEIKLSAQRVTYGIRTIKQQRDVLLL